MKTKSIILAAAIALSHSAFAQTSSTTVAAPSAATNANVATTDAASANDTSVKPLIKYVGYYLGPGLTFSGMQKDDSTYMIEHRVSFGVKINPNLDVGIQTRSRNTFGSGTDLNMTAANFRLYGTFKNVLKDDLYNLTLLPRVILPTSNSARNTKNTLSPDLIAELAIAPKNTRFSFDMGLEYIQYFHTDGAIGSDYTNAMTAEFAPWAEVDYQLTDKTQLMVSYWPIVNAFARQGAAMTSAAAAGGSNEIDLGAYYEIAKGWQLNPYIAAEMNDMDYSSPQKNLQLNLILSAAIL
jgi:hypothetical protein